MPWECAYAELYFTDRLWSEFRVHDLTEALQDFHRRDRRFGRLSEAKKRPTATDALKTADPMMAAPAFGD